MREEEGEGEMEKRKEEGEEKWGKVEEEAGGEEDGYWQGTTSFVPNPKYINLLHLFPLTSHCVF